MSKSSTLSSSSIPISRNELARIKASVLPPTENNYKNERRAELKKLSQDRLQHWPNTLEALRVKKENFLKDREESEEVKRREIDKEEAELRRKFRLESIKRANELLYEQTDKMKMLRSQQLYSDVIHTRQGQIKYKEEQKLKEKEFDAQHHLKIISKVKELDQIEEEKLAKSADLVKVICGMRETQIAGVVSKREAAKSDSIAIGVAMRKQAEEQLKEDIIKQEQKQIRIAESNATMVLANEKQIKLRAEIVALNKINEESRLGEVEVIEDRKKARKVIEIRRFEKQQETRQGIIDRAVESLKNQTNTHNALLTKQEDEIRQKSLDVDKAKQDKIDREWALIVKSRTEQINNRKAKIMQEITEQDAEVLVTRTASEKEGKRLHEKELKTLENIRVVKQIQFNDGIEANRKRVEDRVKAIHRDKVIAEVGLQDDKKFTDTCKSEINRYASEGKPITTLLRALQYTQPDLMGAKLDKTKKKVEE
jgi:hypothetical protein